ncbi:MAG: hypothetical protein DWQ37_13730 [Planctomycetota bacterium]|nr:MAG: hypothetical protein DWQ37_13730 [Planctomycetota bacterium]
MTLMGEACEQKRLRAPVENGGTLIEPPLEQVGELIERNASAIAGFDYDVGGRPLAHLAADARRELLEAAWDYTRAYRDVPRPDLAPETPVLLAGHQPQLFHPGVWFKNFVLSELARRHFGVAVNLAIDSDTIKSAQLRVPTGSAADPDVVGLPYDALTREIPYEERGIVDRECLVSFGARAAETIAPLVRDPLVREFWPLVVERAAECQNLGECLAQARHQQEGLWGAVTLEVPQSHVCSLPSFYWFTCHLLAHLPRLWEHYNQSVADFRRINHTRSTAHPVPDLASDDGWLEAPFWIWHVDDPRRRRLFARQQGEQIVLGDREGLEFALPLQPEGDIDDAAGALAEIASTGIRVRTRALITTLFARLCLGDLFLHGIGGAKYDQVTDLLIQRFFGVKVPCYLTLTATLRLPVAGLDATTPEDARRNHHQLRELVYHPERFIEPGDSEADRLIGEKQQWIATPQTAENARTRCRSIRSANEALQPWVEPLRRQLRAEQHRIGDKLHARSVLGSREYAFCLHPAEALRALMNVPSGSV